MKEKKLAERNNVEVSGGASRKSTGEKWRRGRFSG
jgi:hypothetical protein